MSGARPETTSNPRVVNTLVHSKLGQSILNTLDSDETMNRTLHEEVHSLHKEISNMQSSAQEQLRQQQQKMKVIAHLKGQLREGALQRAVNRRAMLRKLHNRSAHEREEFERLRLELHKRQEKEIRLEEALNTARRRISSSLMALQ